MTSLYLRFWYGFEMVMAYLASNMNDTDSMYNHLDMADRIYIKWWKANHD